MNRWHSMGEKLARLNHLRRELSGLAQEAFRVWQTEGAKAVVDRTYWTVRAHGSTVLAYLGLGVRPYTYVQWIADNEPTEEEVLEQKKSVKQLPLQPLFSIITPVYNPPPAVFMETIHSVLNQSYPKWELLLVDGGSDALGIQEVLTQCEEMDGRIRLIRLTENLGISGNSNVALEAVTGEFVALLDHDDLLAPNMLYEVTSALNGSPIDKSTQNDAEADTLPVDIVYFDEDKVSADSRVRRSPWFKPDFAPDTLLANNILMHCVIRHTLLQAIGGFDPNMDGAQDWDVALRCVERTDRIVHIPKVLYHWRQIEGSAALDANAKPWAYDAQARCLSAHLARLGDGERGAGATITFPSLGQVRIQWPTQNVLVSIVILTKDKPNLIRACISSILEKSTYSFYEIILVDTGSTDPDTLAYYEALSANPKIRIVYDQRRFNFSAANNFGATHAKGDLLLFLNNDTEVLEPTWLEEMSGWAMRPSTAIVGTKLIRPDKTIQHGGIIMGLMGHGAHVYDGGREQSYGIFGSTEWFRNVQAVTGACMMVKRVVFEELGGFDESYEIGFNDIDLCLRAGQQGYRVVYTPYARVLHLEGRSRGFYLPPGDLIRATLQMWPIIKEGDPNFNVNLSYLNRLPDFARPNEQRRDQRLLYILQQFRLVPWAASFEVEHADLFHDQQGPLPIPNYWPAQDRPEQEQLAQDHIPDGQLAQTDTEAQPSSDLLALRVLLVSHDLSLSGGPLMLFQLARYLTARGIRVRIVSPLDGELAARYAEANLSVQVIPDLLTDVRVSTRLLHSAPFETAPFENQSLVSPLEAAENSGLQNDRCIADDEGTLYDVVVANTIISWQIIHVARAFRMPSILWVHESAYGQKLAQEERYYADTLAHASRVVFPTQSTAKLYSEFLDNNQVIIPNGVGRGSLGPESIGPRSFSLKSLEPTDQSPSPRGQADQSTKLSIIAVGSVEPRKGQDFLIQAIQALPPAIHEKVRFVIVGRVVDKTLGRALKRFSNQMSNVEYLGEQSHTETLQLLADSDIFLLTSQDEVLPVTVLEAMSLGKPILSTAVGGLAEVIEHQVNGYLVPYGDVQALAKGLQGLVADSTLRQKIGQEAAKTFEEQYTVEKMGARFVELFNELYLDSSPP